MSELLSIEEIDALNLSSSQQRKGDLHERLEHTERAIHGARALGYLPGLAKAHRNRGAILKNLKRADHALEDLTAALEISREIRNREGEIDAHIELGIAYLEFSATTKALEHLLIARQKAAHPDHASLLARTHNNLGNVYSRLQQFEEACLAFREAERLHVETHNVIGAARAQCNLGRTLMRMGDHSSALELLLKALPQLEKEGLHLDMSLAYSMTGEIYSKLQQYALAEHYFFKALAVADEHDFARGKSSLFGTIGEMYLERGKYDLAEEWLMKSLAINIELSATGNELASLEAISRLWEKRGNFEMALRYHKQFSELKGKMLRDQFKSDIEMRELLAKRERDEHELRMLELKNTELTGANLSLAQMGEHKDDILNIVSHDMRTPLGSIIGMGNLLRTEPQECIADLVNIGTTIEESGLRLLSLANDLLDVSHSESATFRLDRSATDLRALLERSIKLYQPIAARKKIRLSLDSTPPLPEVVIDAPKIGQVMGNLLSNALKFTPSGGVISVAAAPVDDALRISVKDTGIGIPSDFLPHVFEKFGKHQRSGTEGEHGTGLGMPIVKRFVELHHGTISVESTEEQGTTVYIDLPLTK